jgi:hypothetical protein
LSEKPPVVFDANVLLNFATDVHAFYLLRQRFEGRGTWAFAVREEIVRLANRLPPQPQANLAMRFSEWLGTPHRIEEEEELQKVEALRLRIARDGDHPREHLGEAASIVLAHRLGGILATDDSGAKVLAKEESVLFASTPKILYGMVRDDQVSCDEAWGIYMKMLDRDRGLPEIAQADLCAGRVPD